MKTPILDIIEKETHGKSYKTLKYGLDHHDYSPIDYDDNHDEITWRKYGENMPFKGPIDVWPIAEKWKSERPLFSYFLDGSRRVYKVDDLAISKKVYPIIAGQIGISCCKRVNKVMQKHSFERILAIALPSTANPDTWGTDVVFGRICQKINEANPFLKKYGLEFKHVLSYSTKHDEFEKLESKGIAAIQDLMIKREIAMVSSLVKSCEINEENYLLKDGSLEYKVDHLKNEADKRDFRALYNYVVGVSKSFNPENCIDRRGKNNSDLIANLPLFHRTPVSLYSSPRLSGMFYAVWYLRIRDRKYTINPFDGILKIEKILNDEDELLDTEVVNLISGNLINERNPTCYGADSRWANHLYPIYVTEAYAKSKYLSTSMFLNLF